VQESTVTEVKAGLEGVYVGQSSISFIDGQEGVLIYRGIDIHELAPKSTFEETAFLLWFGHLPTPAELEDLNRDIRSQYALPAGVIDILGKLPRTTSPMAALRTGVSALSGFDPDASQVDKDANVRKAIRLTAQLGTLVATFDRLRQGKPLLDPDESRSIAGNFLYLLNGEEPSETAVRALDTALILHADHGLNASTFAARVTASTLSDMHSALTSAVGTLKGPLHGGANEQVMVMLKEIGDPERAEDWVRRAIDEKQRIMGIGHRVYKTLDPRAVHLKHMSKELGEQSGQPHWYAISEMVEDAVRRAKDLYANVDFYSASTYHVLGLETDLFTPVFAISRVAGWTAHLLEQYGDNRLIRPRLEYVGPKNVPYVPIEERS
jgi:citrate synthase